LTGPVGFGLMNSMKQQNIDNDSPKFEQAESEFDIHPRVLRVLDKALQSLSSTHLAAAVAFLVLNDERLDKATNNVEERNYFSKHRNFQDQMSKKASAKDGAKKKYHDGCAEMRQETTVGMIVMLNL
jgi:hypothetical protein